MISFRKRDKCFVVAEVSANHDLTKALGMPLADFRRLRLSLASVNVLDFKGRVASLVSFNDTCHLVDM